jgi:hypothetical protein
MLPERIRDKLNARYGVHMEEDVAAPRQAPTGTPSNNESMAQRMARRRQERSAERTASLIIEDSREGPPAFHGLGLRDDYTNPQRMWQEQAMQNRQRSMENQMQREQAILQQRMIEKEKMQVERQKRRAAAMGKKPGETHLKVGAEAMQLNQGPR